MALEKKYITLVVPENFSGRLDTFLQGSLPEKLSLSRSKVKSFILSGNVGRGDKYVRDPSKKVKSTKDGSITSIQAVYVDRKSVV